jgi:hypothetical protein
VTVTPRIGGFATTKGRIRIHKQRMLENPKLVGVKTVMRAWTGVFVNLDPETGRLEHVVRLKRRIDAIGL